MPVGTAWLLTPVFAQGREGRLPATRYLASVAINGKRSLLRGRQDLRDTSKSVLLESSQGRSSGNPAQVRRESRAALLNSRGPLSLLSVRLLSGVLL